MLVLAFSQVLAADVPEKPYPHALRTRTIGQVVTVPGIALGGLGTTLMVTGLVGSRNCTNSPEPSQCGLGPALAVVFGGLGLAASTPFLAVGLPMWVTGHKRHRANKDARPVSMQLMPELTPHRQGLILTGRF